MCDWIKWLKNYIAPPPSPELKQLFDEAATARAQHSVALDNYHEAVEKMLRRMDKANKVIDITVKQDNSNVRKL